MAEPRKLETKMSDDTRIALLEQSISHINETMTRIDRRFDSLESNMNMRFDKVDARIDGLAHEIKQGNKDLNARMWHIFLWIMTSGGAVLGFIAHKLNWIS